MKKVLLLTVLLNITAFSEGYGAAAASAADVENMQAGPLSLGALRQLHINGSGFGPAFWEHLPQTLNASVLEVSQGYFHEGEFGRLFSEHDFPRLNNLILLSTEQDILKGLERTPPSILQKVDEVSLELINPLDISRTEADDPGQLLEAVRRVAPNVKFISLNGVNIFNG
jgi:hypothetical protein